MSSYNFGFCTLRRVCHEYFYRLILFRRIHWHNYYYQVWNFFLHFSTLCFALINQKSKNLMTVWINAGIFTNKYQPCNCYCNFPVKTDILIIIIMHAVDMSHGDRLETIVCSKVTKDLSITILNGLNQTKIVGGKICF